MYDGLGGLPWRDHAFGTYNPLPGDSLAIKPLCWVIREVFETYAYLAGSLGFWGVLAGS